MGRLLIVALVLVIASTALAGDNPDVAAYISLDQTGAGGQIHGYQPAPYESVRVYVCYTQLYGGLTAVSFRLTDVMAEYPGVFAAPSFTNLLPGGVTVGDPFEEGITLASIECMTDPVVCVGYLDLTYLGGGGCIELLDHVSFPRWVIDCNDPGQVDFYTTLASGTVGDACCAPGPYQISVHCEPQGPPNPTHPPTYWYDAHLGFFDCAAMFRVQVFDPNPANYTNWVAPDVGMPWTYGLEQEGEDTWAVWRGGPMLGSSFRFAFDNPNPSTWGHWQFGSHESEDFSGYSDGCGYRVHVPAAATPVEQGSWGTIKALFR